MERESWKDQLQQHLDGLVQAFEQRTDSKALAEYFRNVSNELDQAETLHFKILQQFWYRHKRVAALLDVKKQIPRSRKHAWGDLSHKPRQTEDRFDTDDILSITNAWDLESEKLEVLRDNVQRCLNEDRDFFKSNRVEEFCSPDDDLTEAEKAFDSVDKDANGAYRVFKKQVPKAKSYCIGRRINSNKCVTTYLSEKRWVNLSPTVRKEKHDKLARWRGHGEKWLSLEEPAIALAFSHIPSEHRCFYEFERRRLSIRAFNAVIRTLQAVAIIDGLRKLWCRQLIRKRLNTECHPNHCFCNGTDVALDEAPSIEPPTHVTVDNEQQWSKDAELMQRQPDSQSPGQPHIPSKRLSEFETTSDFALTSSKRPCFESRDEGQGTTLTPVSQWMASSVDDNRSEQSPESQVLQSQRILPRMATLRKLLKWQQSQQSNGEHKVRPQSPNLENISYCLHSVRQQDIPLTYRQLVTGVLRECHSPWRDSALKIDRDLYAAASPQCPAESRTKSYSTLPPISNGGRTRRNASNAVENDGEDNGGTSFSPLAQPALDLDFPDNRLPPFEQPPASNERAQIAASYVPSAPYPPQENEGFFNMLDGDVVNPDAYPPQANEGFFNMLDGDVVNPNPASLCHSSLQLHRGF
ncbi:hypothetical protein ACJ73_08375 [Blastomyces percursus]|uniref:Uncharacterized protein n=1 Tax=Blastomyces percursus TaxID=1658174 RepID=A0A1J9QJB7_9EURO|nr:hypothetical protein ACJ73_08375 [Blastomyces percursus]